MSRSVKLKKVVRFLWSRTLYLNFFGNLIKFMRMSKEPIIICGCPRSGTSLLMSILDSHMEVHVIPFETAVLQFRPMEKRVFKSKVLYSMFLRCQLVAYLFSGSIKKTARHWCEKTPLNILNIEEINQLYRGNIKFINIVRDGRDVVASFHPRFGYMVKPQLWEKCILQTFKFVEMSNFLVVRYEDLVNDSKSELHKIKLFLNLRANFDVNGWLERTSIKGYVHSPVNNNMGTSPILSDVNKDSIGKWKQSLSPYVKEFLDQENFKILNKRLGYE